MRDRRAQLKAKLTGSAAVERPRLGELLYSTLRTLGARCGIAATSRDDASRHRDCAEKPRSLQAFWTSMPRVVPWFEGWPLTIRPQRRDDLDLETAFVRSLSARTRSNRLLGAGATFTRETIDRLVDVDQSLHVALIATSLLGDAKETQIGVARYVVDSDGTSAEFAVTVADAWQGSGVGRLLMQALIECATASGLRLLVGEVFASNAPMLKLARHLGFEAEECACDASIVRVVKTLGPPGRTALGPRRLG